MVYRVEEARRGEERLLVIIIILFCLYIGFNVIFTTFCRHVLFIYGDIEQMNTMYFYGVAWNGVGEHVVHTI